MKILLYYPVTGTMQVFECEKVEIGAKGLTWTRKGNSGFIGFCPDCQVTIVKNKN